MSKEAGTPDRSRRPLRAPRTAGGANARQAQRRGRRVGVEPFLPGKPRPAQRQFPSVEGRQYPPRQPLQAGTVHDHDAVLEQRRAATTCTIGTASPSAQGQVMMITAMATRWRGAVAVAAIQPGGQERGGMQPGNKAAPRGRPAGDSGASRLRPLPSGAPSRPERLPRGRRQLRRASRKVVVPACSAEPGGDVRGTLSLWRWRSRSPTSLPTTASTGNRTPAACQDAKSGAISLTGR